MSAKPDEVPLPNAQSLQQIIGTLLFGSDRALTPSDIRSCLRQVAEKHPEDTAVQLYGQMSENEIRDVLEGVRKEFQRIGVGFELVESSIGFRFQTQVAAGRWLRQMLKTEQPARLSRPTLETLAIIAYRQPISKPEIESIRGVSVDYIVKALMELQLVRIIGRSDLPGRPFLYGTTPSFLEHFGLKSLTELNELDPTLQRSLPAERNAKHKKPKPVEKEKELRLEQEAVADVKPIEPTEQPIDPQEERSLDELTGALSSAIVATNTRIDEMIRDEEAFNARIDEADEDETPTADEIEDEVADENADGDDDDDEDEFEDDDDDEDEDEFEDEEDEDDDSDEDEDDE